MTRVTLAISVVLAVLATCAGWTAANAAASELLFDPTLSLTGGCTPATSLDPVPDPGCPGGPLPPSGSFAEPTSVATDAYGNIYVASFGLAKDGSEGRIDIFDSSGRFLTELDDSDGPRSIAIDSVGTLYVANGIDANAQARRVVRYAPSLYSPASGEIEYGNPPVTIRAAIFARIVPIAVNSANDHLFENLGSEIVERGSAAEANPVLGQFGKNTELNETGLAIDAAHGRVYAPGLAENRAVIRVFALAPPHARLPDLTGASLPAGKFHNFSLSLGVDEGNGHLFVYDREINRLYELTEGGVYVKTYEHGFQTTTGTEVGVDNGAFSPNGALNPRGRYFFIASNPTGVGHSYAFGPLGPPCEPEVSSPSFAEVSETEAELLATINPCNLETTYRFEYTTQEQFEAEGFGGAQVAGSGQLAAARIGTEVRIAVQGLSPGTAYRFLVVATNEEGSSEAEGSFNTYPAEPEPEPCPNAALRTGFSTLLPDCRAYELVTPADTNSRAPLALGKAGIGIFFSTREASPSGEQASFRLEGGAIPGVGGTGSLHGDPYLATRGTTGWSTSYAGPPAFEAPDILPGSHSPDQGYSFWANAGEGSSAVNGTYTTYVRYPDGHSALVGRGSLGTTPQAAGDLIGENGSHIVFDTRSMPFVGSISGVQLEPNAPPTGTEAVYDRTPDEVTHVVSLLPGNVTPGKGENASYKGASLDGRGVAFAIGSKLYLRFDDTETYKVGENVTFAGVAEGGARIFYLKGADLFAFDAEEERTIRFTEAGNVTPVNVAADGAAAYFVSPSVLTEAANSNGDKAVEGGKNLYLSREGAVSFVGTVTERDVVGEKFPGESSFDGLGLWTAVVGHGELGADPSRTTPDGSVLLFQSRADLTGYDSQGHTEIYRYDSAGGELSCLSCKPTGSPAAGDATLQPMTLREGKEARSPFILVENLRSDGRRAFFQSSEALVARDTDQLQDIYEWEDEGVATCKRPGGCVYLISSGKSQRSNSLHAVSESGNDVFFVSSDLLLGADSDETPSIYDARVGGGFPESGESVCEGEGCRGALTAPPVLPTPVTPAGVEGGKPSPAKHCPKGSRRVKRHGKLRCLKRHHRHRHRAGGKKGVGR